MSKYKLIKEYPLSPKLGTIIKKSPNHWWGIQHDDNCFSGCNAPQNPTNYPEFWEEVKKKEYEVLKFQIDSSIFEYYPKKESEYKWRNFNGNWAWSYIPAEAKLISVKRLSDGKIFTVGDKVEHKGVSTFTITHMRIHEETLQISSGFGIVVSINEIEHQKKPLFITRDNVKIYKGDKYYCLHQEDNDGKFTGKVLVYTAGVSDYCFIRAGFLFSTKKAAKKYLDNKKPLFVTEYGLEIYGDNIYYFIRKNPVANNVICLTKGSIKHDFTRFMYFSSRKAAEKWVEKNKPKYSRSQINKAINNLFSSELKNDNHVFAKAIIEGYTEAFFKELNNDA